MLLPWQLRVRFPPPISCGKPRLGLGLGLCLGLGPARPLNKAALETAAALCKRFSRNVASFRPIEDGKLSFLSSTLSSCIDRKRILEGRNAHHHLIACGLERNGDLQQLLVRMYAACEAVEEGFLLLSCLQDKDAAAWNSLLVPASCGSGRLRNHGKLHLFQQMLHEGTLPNKSSFVKILSCLSHNNECRSEGVQMHIHLRNMGFESDAAIGTTLINMYGKSGNLRYVWMAFEHVECKDVVLCTGIITVYARHQKMIDALRVFSLMHEAYRLIPNKVTFLCLVDACSGCQGLSEGKIAHHAGVESGFSADVMVGNALVDMYGKCCSLKEARWVFKGASKKNSVSWSVMINAHLFNQSIDEALKIFYEMHRHGIDPNRATLVCVLQACAYVDGAIIHAYLVENSFDMDQVIATALISFYSKCSNVQDAREVFFRVPSKDVIAWNAMISGYATLDHFQAIHAFNQMQYHRLMPNASTCVSILETCAKNMDLDEGKRIHAFVVNNKIQQDVILQTAIMNMYGKCGDVSTACDMFANIRKRSLITWNTIISVCAQKGRIGEAIRILKEMQESRVKPNSVTFIGVLDACSESISLDEGQWIHSSVVEAGVDLDANLGSALINMYGKCGLLENAWNIFEALPEKSVILMTTFMSVLAKHGLADRVFQLLCVMHEKRIKPNHVTFINVLTACNHDGLVKGAYQWFSSMYNDYEVTPLVDHYICLVDILGRAALLDEAERLVDIMPFQSPWLSLLHLLGACRQQMDTERGYRVATRLLEIDSVDPSPYVIMSNMYAIADQDFDDAR